MAVWCCCCRNGTAEKEGRSQAGRTGAPSPQPSSWSILNQYALTTCCRGLRRPRDRPYSCTHFCLVAVSGEVSLIGVVGMHD